MVQDEPTTKLIIDTDPGVDDVMAILLALNQPNVDLKLISLVFGNCDTVNSLRNAVSLFHVLKLEQEHRKKLGKPAAPWVYKSPVISVGMTTALDGSKMDATEFHGADGLANVHTTNPEYTAAQEQIDWFKQESSQNHIESCGFTPSTRPSYEEILDVLRAEPANTVSIAAIGPLQNLAKAAELEPETFAKVKEVVVMGAAFQEPGNVGPNSEFNVFADPVASAQVYALSSPNPQYTLPKGSPECLKNFPKPLNITLFPLDITHNHDLTEQDFEAAIKDLAVKEKSPLAMWIYAWMGSMFAHSRSAVGKTVLNVHDALTVWYVISQNEPGWQIKRDQDIRVETDGVWTRGMTVVDNRGRPKLDEPGHNDRGLWLVKSIGNRVHYAVDSPCSGEAFGPKLFELIL